MKVKNPNELWVLNRTASDVHLSDLGVKVPAGKAVNIYHVNPYLAKHQVEASREIGSLSKRLASGTLVVVKRAVKDVPQALKNIKESKESNIKAVKTKSSVVLEPDEPVDEEDGGFDFADYGVVDAEPPTAKVQEDGLVTMAAKQDEPTDQDPGIKLTPTVESGVSQQSQVVMKARQDVMVDPTGPHAETSYASRVKPFVIAKPPKGHDLPTTEESVEPQHSIGEEVVARSPSQQQTAKDAAIAAALKARRAEKAKTPTGKTVSKDETGTIVVDGETTANRSIKTVKKAQDEGTTVEEAATDNSVEFNPTEYDSKVATKTEDGAIVMKLKEDEKTTKPKKKKKAVTKKVRTSKKEG